MPSTWAAFFSGQGGIPKVVPPLLPEVTLRQIPGRLPFESLGYTESESDMAVIDRNPLLVSLKSDVLGSFWAFEDMWVAKVSQRSPKVSQRFPKSSKGRQSSAKDLPKVSQGVPKVSQDLPKVFPRSPKVSQSEDFGGRGSPLTLQRDFRTKSRAVSIPIPRLPGARVRYGIYRSLAS